MRRIVSAEFCFENSEWLEIDAKHFGYIDIDGIRKRIMRVAVNAVCEMEYADKIAMEISREANDTYSAYSNSSCITTKFDRILSHDDIVSITFRYDDGSLCQYIVDYDDGDAGCSVGAPNINQHASVSHSGNLYIVIGKSMEVFDTFDPDHFSEAVPSVF